MRSNFVNCFYPLVIVPNTGGDLVQNFNPFNTSVNSEGEWGFIYETLLFFNRADGSIKPWLASSYSYNTASTQITFKIRQGVSWSDGQPFTSADVAFTFNLIKQNASIDTNGIGGSLKSITAPDPQTVVITLMQASSSLLWFIGGQTWMVPQHIWSTVGDPSKYANENPVGTGPYVLKSFSPQLVVLTKNPHFWQPGKPVVPQLNFPAYNSNDSAELAMNTDQTDWNGLYVPNIQNSFIKRDPSQNHYYFPPSDPVMLFLNLTKAPFNQVIVRKAISLALDRNQMSTVGESGYEPPANPTGVILPAGSQYIDPQYANASFTMDVNQAQQDLATAGYTKGGDGILVGKDGKRLAFNLDVISGYTDWISDCQIIASNLKAIGIAVTINQLQSSTFLTQMGAGNFDMGIWSETPGPTPYYIYYQALDSVNSAPIGQNANTNYERWMDPTTDKLLAQFDSTTDLAKQQQAMYQLEAIAVNQLPVIFLMNEPYWYEYNTVKYTGWPDKGNLYAEPSPYSYPDDEIVVLNLQSV